MIMTLVVTAGIAAIGAFTIGGAIESYVRGDEEEGD